MALVEDPIVRASVTFQDRDKNTSNTSVLFPTGNTVANIIAELEEDLIPALVGASDAIVVGYSINFGATDYDNLALQAPETSDVERKGVFMFRAPNGQIGKMEVPSIKNTLVVDGTNVINMADPLAAAVETAILTAGVDGLQPSTNTGAAYTAREGTPHKIHRKSRKG